jgi:thioesterase domain-containing protein
MEVTTRNVLGGDSCPDTSKPSALPTTEDQILSLYQDMFGIRIEPDEDFLEFDNDAIDYSIAFVGRINEYFDRSFDLSVLAEARTPSALSQLIHGLKPCNVDIVHVGRSSNDTPPVFCFAASAESVLGYKTLQAEFNGVRSASIFLPPGGTGRENTLDLQSQITRYIEIVKDLQIRGPYYLIGEGRGGVFAYEVANQLVSQGKQVALLALIDTLGPDAIEVIPSWRSMLRTRIQILNTRIAQRLYRSRLKKGKADRINRWPTGRKHFSRTRMKSTEQDVLRQKALQTDLLVRQLTMGHIPAPYYGRIILFRSSKLNPNLRSDRTLGWRSVFPDGGLVVREIPSYYGSMLKQPFVSSLASELRSVIAATQ